MRYVDLTEVELDLPDDWTARVEKAKSSVERATETARKKAESLKMSSDEVEVEVRKARAKSINTQSDVWSYAGKILREAMHGKCWYCETYESRSDMPVDHFRPKNSVVECNGKHSGYWWLAFEWTNYRFSCTYCNSRRSGCGTSGGKQDHFPLLDPDTRAWTEVDDLGKEMLELLDPCDPDDPKLLVFAESGGATCIGDGPTSSACRRVETSIRLYHLDHVRLRRERKRIAIKIRQKVQTIKALDAQGQLTAPEKNLRKEALKEIIRCVRSKTPFCSAARCYLSGFRDLPWVPGILERDL
jgi:uncharacterized protein (TIGR02646 family)